MNINYTAFLFDWGFRICIGMKSKCLFSFLSFDFVQFSALECVLLWMLTLFSASFTGGIWIVAEGLRILSQRPWILHDYSAVLQTWIFFFHFFVLDLYSSSERSHTLLMDSLSSSLVWSMGHCFTGLWGSFHCLFFKFVQYNFWPRFFKTFVQWSCGLLISLTVLVKAIALNGSFWSTAQRFCGFLFSWELVSVW